MQSVSVCPNMPAMRGVSLISMAIVGALLAGCGSGSSDTSSSTVAEAFRIPAPAPKIVYAKELKFRPDGLVGNEPKPFIPDTPPPESLALFDLDEGIGPLADEGSKLTVQYVGYLYDSERKFVSSWDQGKPFTFTLGAGQVIDGWEEGILGMEVSDKRELVIPPSLTTGGSRMPDVPQGKTLVYVVGLLKVRSPSSSSGSTEKPAATKETESAKKKTKPKVVVPKGAPPKALTTKDLEQGTGPAAKAGDEVTVQYVGVNYKTGKEFDASWDRGEPFTFSLGSGMVIPGWEEGVEGMKVGGRRELIIPPELGYGSAGSPPAIPPNETLVFVVDLEAIN